MTKLLNLPQKYTVFPLKDLSLSNNTRNSNNACNSNNFMQQLFSVTFESKAMKRNNNCRSFFEEIGIYVKCQVETCLDQIKKKQKTMGLSFLRSLRSPGGGRCVKIWEFGSIFKLFPLFIITFISKSTIYISKQRFGTVLNSLCH